MVKKTGKGKSKRSKDAEVLNDNIPVASNINESIGSSEEARSNLAAQPSAADTSQLNRPSRNVQFKVICRLRRTDRDRERPSQRLA